MIRGRLLFILFTLFLAKSDAKGYCGPEICNNTKEHTLCIFQSEDPARHCIDHERTIKTWKDRQTILDKLNSRRNKVAAGDIRSLPAAEGMMKLDWNEELALSAQRWADQCVRHTLPDILDACRDLGGAYVGQSIATVAGEAPGLTPAALVDVWYMELLNVNASILPRYQPSAVAGFSNYDYFTQLVWAETRHVGCGAVKFKERVPDISRERNRTIYRLVCNFAPGGNRLNRPVYTEGVPCSRCPDGGNCDTLYKALCASKIFSKKPFMNLDQTKFSSTVKLSSTTTARKSTNANPTTTTKSHESVSSTTDEENFTPFDYFSHLHEFIRPSLTTTPTTPMSCKDVLAIEDFIELLKKKLTNDPLFKDLMQTTKFPPGIDLDADPNVSAFVSKLYSRKTAPTSTTVTSDYVNSTLLVDLVEAVIFRSSDKTRSTYTAEHTTQQTSDVSAIKIQAELAEVKQNTDFTGHYFFPEDVEKDSEPEVSTEVTDSYYDATSPQVADVVKEIEDMKRTKHTKDFLDDILDSESNIEKGTTTISKVTNVKAIVASNYSSIANEQKRLKREGILRKATDIDNKYIRRFKSYKDIQLKSIQPNYAQLGYRFCHVKYSELLKKLASDLGVLKLNERFHCVANFSHRLKCTHLVLFLYILLK